MHLLNCPLTSEGLLAVNSPLHLGWSCFLSEICEYCCCNTESWYASAIVAARPRKALMFFGDWLLKGSVLLLLLPSVERFVLCQQCAQDTNKRSCQSGIHYLLRLSRGDVLKGDVLNGYYLEEVLQMFFPSFTENDDVVKVSSTKFRHV